MRWTTTAMVATFAVVDVLVLGGAYVLSQGRVGVDDPALTPSSASSAPASGAGTGSASGAATPSAAATGKNEWTGPLALSASPSGALLRVTRGSCDERQPVTARAWLAPSFKAPLEEVTVPGLQESLGVSLTDSQVTIVGTGPRCKVSGWTSTDDGQTWTKGEVPDDVWYLDTDSTASVVHGPVDGGDVTVDCIPVAVTTRDAGRTAWVSCTSQNVLRIDRDAEDEEVPLVYSVPGPAGATDVPDGRPIALATVSGCTATVMSLVENRQSVQGRCLGTKDAALGIAVSGDRVFAQVGYQLMLSTDGGRTFAAYPEG